MTAKLVHLNRTPSMADALETIDQLRREIEAGRVIAFAAVAIEQGDECIAYCSAIKPVSRLRLQGAIAQLQHDYIAGEL